MKIYKANKKGFINYLLIGFMILPIFIFFIDKENFIEKPFVFLVLWIPFFLFLWIYFDTVYKIYDNTLLYRSGFIKGEIDIATIKEITVGKTVWSGIKPALAQKGLMIRFNRYDEIYIAPENNEEIIADLLKINSDITIIE